MFFPNRSGDDIIFDIRLLVPAKSPAEERIYLEAVRRTPVIFHKGKVWGEEPREACLSIAAPLYDTILQDIRLSLRHDPVCLRACISEMHESVARLGAALKEGTDFPVLLEACANAVAWFAANWLHPRMEVRHALARWRPSEDPAPLLAGLLRRRESPLYLRAHARLREVAEGRLSREEFLATWGPVYARGDEPGPLACPADLERLLEETDFRTVPADPEPRLREEQEAIRAGLLAHARSHSGPEAAALLALQIDYLEAAIDAKEDRHFVQQHAYRQIRRVIVTADQSERQHIAERCPWFAPALRPRLAGQLHWPHDPLAE